MARLPHLPLPEHALLAAIVDSSDDAIVSKNLQGVVTSWNPGAERIFGYTAAEMIGQPITRLFPPERENEEPAILARLVRGERVDHFETVRVRKDGRRIDVSVTISPVRDASGTVVGASKIARDISEHKALDRKLREHAAKLQLFSEQIHAQNEELHLQNEELTAQNDALAQADRQKNEYLAMLAHELRNPLAPVLYSVHLLRSSLPAEDNRARHAAVIERQINHMVRLLDDLLEVSRVIHGTVQLRQEVVDLGLLVYSVAQNVHDYLQERRQDLSIEVPRVALTVKGDPVRLEQVITNLLNNAVKFTAPGGSIRISVVPEGKEAVLRVKDSGVGIAPGLLPHVFELFTQAEQGLSRTQGGLGIGLTMVRSLVEMHDGTVEAHSAGTGQGAEFVVRLPLIGGEAPPEKVSPPGEASAGAARRVLVVDDLPDSADTLRDLLDAWGHEVRAVYSGEAALEAAAALEPEIVLLDIGMPGLDGYEVAARLRKAHPTLKIVALTGYGQESDRLRSVEAGFDEHLLKPVDPEVLRRLMG
jgi:two-component system, chemotaxis family, CheB/CheR fusion protein